jgi:hypothetical protein
MQRSRNSVQIWVAYEETDPGTEKPVASVIAATEAGALDRATEKLARFDRPPTQPAARVRVRRASSCAEEDLREVVSSNRLRPVRG